MAKILKEITELTRKMKGCQDRRNRILHDPWYVEVEGDATEQYKSMARDENLSGFHPVDETFLTETIEKFGRRISEIDALEYPEADAIDLANRAMTAIDL